MIPVPHLGLLLSRLCSNLTPDWPSSPPCFAARSRFTGDCADLFSQFQGIEGLGLEDAEDVTDCPQFPDDANPVHMALVGVICTAVALPFSIVVGELLTKSNEPEFPEGQLSWPWYYGVVFGKQRWHYQVRTVLTTAPRRYRCVSRELAHSSGSAHPQRLRLGSQGAPKPETLKRQSLVTTAASSDQLFLLPLFLPPKDPQAGRP